MRTRIGLGIALLLASTACTGSVFSNPDAGPTPGDDAGAVPPNGGGGSHDGGGADGADSGSDAGTVDAAPPPPGCDVTKLPTEDVCVVNDAEGVFVSSSMGTAGNDGTKAKPFSSLDAAIAAAKTAHKRVYACAETYIEQIHLADGVDVFGYLDCHAGWAVASAHAKVAAPASPAATADGIADATRVEAVDLVAPDYASGSQSSIGLIADSSPALTIKSAIIHAGTGGNGANGTNGIKLTDSPSTKNGQASRIQDVCTGGSGHCFVAIAQSLPGGTNTCSGAAGHDPGPGGNGGWDGRFQSISSSWVTSGQATTGGFPTVATAQTAQGGSTGKFGAGPQAGAPGANGANGATGGAFGSLSANGYAPANGTDGGDGAPGQGGGGAGGQALMSNIWDPAAYDQKYGHGETGASGGAGGCPGLAGTAGEGGGASIAVVAIASPFTMDTVTIEASNGGAGGSAGSSSTNTNGGMGGLTGPYTKTGGPGGAGGFAGVSGNGGGGPSVGVAYQGTAPTQLATSVTVGSGGAGVPSGTDPGNGVLIPASPAGVSQNTYSF